VVKGNAADQPFYFIVTFWGAEFRRSFLQLCAASLLSPQNLPALARTRTSRFLVCTTQEDWDAISSDAVFQLLKRYADPILIKLQRPVPEFLRPVFREKMFRTSGSPLSNESLYQYQVSPLDVATPEAFHELQRIGSEIHVKLTVYHHYALRILFMSAGHKAAACLTHTDQAYGIFLAPDMVLSDGSLMHLNQLADQGKKVVMVSACRFSQEECIQEFEGRDLMKSGLPLVLPSEVLIEIVLGHLHPETECFEFDSPYFCDVATSAFWRACRDEGLLLHSFFWAPLLVSYREIEKHYAEYFDEGGTTDGKYIALHFNTQQDITPIYDSHDIFLASFTPRTEYYYPVKSHILKRLSYTKIGYKTYLLQKTLYGPMGDPVKRWLFSIPVRIHTGVVKSEAWAKCEQAASVVVNRALRHPSIFRKAMMRVHRAFEQGFRSFAVSCALYPVRMLPKPFRQFLRNLFR